MDQKNEKNEQTPAVAETAPDNLTPAQRSEFNRIAESDRRRSAKNPDTARLVRMPKAGDMQANVQFDTSARRIVTDYDEAGKEGTGDVRQLTPRNRTSTIIAMFHLSESSWGVSIEEEQADGQRVKLTGTLESQLRHIIRTLSQIK